uniref:Uncharacterized protein n=1 Tax=Myoviridae sp. ctrMq22 TaxID=2825181 RepID=A0A8S5NUR6_9CAUD|nr:MAG TPA: hypothetical protein [Myoviridae sp. ctrMq22]
MGLRPFSRFAFYPVRCFQSDTGITCIFFPA